MHNKSNAQQSTDDTAQYSTISSDELNLHTNKAPRSRTTIVRLFFFCVCVCVDYLRLHSPCSVLIQFKATSIIRFLHVICYVIFYSRSPFGFTLICSIFPFCQLHFFAVSFTVHIFSLQILHATTVIIYSIYTVAHTASNPAKQQCENENVANGEIKKIQAALQRIICIVLYCRVCVCVCVHWIYM